MKLTANLFPYFLAAILLFSISCKKNSTGNDSDLSETLEPVEDVIPVPGGESSTITVNLNEEEAYFDIGFSEIEPNDIIENGVRKAWCIDVRQPLDHFNGTYTDISLYSTYRVEKWKPLNYMFNIKEELEANDSELTWLEFQVAIWSLRANPKFDLDEVNIEDLPSQFQSDGEPKFNTEKVKELLNTIEEEYKEFEYSEGTNFAVIAETPPDSQTVITIVE